MVKYLKHFWTGIKRMVLISTMMLLVLAFWLHGKERSLSVAKPLIEKALNSADAPFVMTIGDVTVNWYSVAELGKLHIKNVTLAKRDGIVFAQLPDMFATIDPIGFLPTRHLLHKVILRGPRLFLARNADKVMELGIEGSDARMPFTDMTSFFGNGDAAGTAASAAKPPSLPFHDFIIQGATLTFTDENTNTKIVSTPFEFSLGRRHHSYDAALSMPFTVDDVPVKVAASMRALPRSTDHVLAVQLVEVPSKLLCLFDTCPQKVEASGPINAAIAVAIAQDMQVHDFRATLMTPKAVFNAPEWFAEPLKLDKSTLAIAGDWSKHEINLTEAKLDLEDTFITASAQIHKGEDGWYATAEGETTRLNVDKIYKYWPLFMAPDSRTWITGKLKSGYAAKGTMKLNLTPADMAADVLPDKAIDAVADARDITFEYLPGFPLVEKMNGIAHFTGTTVKVEGSGGSLMSGTKINHAVLWCPELNSPRNPMEATISLTAPAADAVTMLALPYFPFDDQFELNAKTIKGSVDADMKLKFNAFSDKPNANPNEIHLEAVDYDITANMKDVAQDNVYGGYNARGINGVLKATNTGLNIDSSVTLGDAAGNDVKLSQPTGKPLVIAVKGRPSGNAKIPSGTNDFTLSYGSSDVPAISIKGKKLDASTSYGGAEHSLLANFPAMKLDIDLGELLLANDKPFTDVKATLNCTAVRCESADFSAKTDSTIVKGGITKDANGQRQFALTANDAGSMLTALDITDRMTKGNFQMSGGYDDKKSPPQLNARLIIEDFNLKNSQILGRILSVASLTGIANALTGSGISFDKLSANIASQSGVITVDKGMANGTALGITLGGTIDTNTSKLNLKGVLAPAYALNSIFGKIPVIGMLAGGEGEGLIGFNFSVKGTYKEPDVGVNPLSGLTPGFLRGIFGAFDDKSGKPGDSKAKSFKPAGQSLQNSNVVKH